MLKKRLIFTLLYDDGYFMLSRNFRLQKVGDLSWLNINYNFAKVAYSIDELVILDVTRKGRNLQKFCATIKELSEKCFIPIAAGGGLESAESARRLLQSGADKVVINSALFSGEDVQGKIAREFGQSSVVASLDLKRSIDGDWEIWTMNGQVRQEGNTRDWISRILESEVGEVYFNSIDKDGTAQGLDLDVLDLLPESVKKPVIVAGGAGNSSHLLTALQDIRVDAVATANLFNFVGDGLQRARELLVRQGIILPMWELPSIGSR